MVLNFFKKRNDFAAETETDIVLEQTCRLRLNLQQRHDEILLEFFFLNWKELAAKTENYIVSEYFLTLE